MGVAHLLLAQPPAPVLVDEVLAGEAVVDLAAPLPGTAQGMGVETHSPGQASHRADSATP